MLPSGTDPVATTAGSAAPAHMRVPPEIEFARKSDAAPGATSSIFHTANERPNETKLSDRRRKRAAPQISLLKLSCENFLAGRRFAGAHG